MALRSKLKTTREDTATREEQLLDEHWVDIAKRAGGFLLVAIAAAFVFTPLLVTDDTQLADSAYGIDTLATATTGARSTKRRYTIHRSVLQDDPTKPCYIFEDGTRRGHC